MTKSGSTEIVVPAMITGHGVERPSLTGSVEIATISVNISLERMKINGQKKSFQRAMKAMDAHAASAGATTGTTICQ